MTMANFTLFIICKFTCQGTRVSIPTHKTKIHDLVITTLGDRLVFHLDVIVGETIEDALTLAVFQ